MNKRIGIYDPYLDDVGGGEKYMLSIAESLASDNIVDVFWDRKEDLELAHKRFSINLSRVNLVENIFSHKIGFLKRWLMTRKYDVLIVLSDGSIPFSLSKKLFIHIQQPISGIKRKPKTQIKLKRVSRVFCNSFFSKSFVDKDLGVNSLVIYPPVKIGKSKIKKENIIVHVGRFRVRDLLTGASDYKKQNIMVEAFKKIVQGGLKDWKFVVCVSVREEEKESLDNLIKKTKGYPIEFLINKSNDELWSIYASAKIYWHASGYGENLSAHPEYAEHFGMSTVEAMGMGAVPVVINAGGQKEIVEDGKNGYLWNDLIQLEEKTLLLVKNDSAREGMAQEAMKRAKDFSIDKFNNEIREMINNG